MNYKVPSVPKRPKAIRSRLDEKFVDEVQKRAGLAYKVQLRPISNLAEVVANLDPRHFVEKTANVKFYHVERYQKREEYQKIFADVEIDGRCIYSILKGNIIAEEEESYSGDENYISHNTPRGQKTADEAEYAQLREELAQIPRHEQITCDGGFDALPGLF